jgi:hypothetical protein
MTKFYTLVLVVFSTFSQLFAQQALLSGAFPGTSEALLATRYRNVRTSNSSQTDATYTGIPDLGSNRAGSRVNGTLTYSDEGSYTFTLTYNVAANTYTTTTVADGVTRTSTLTNVSSRLTTDGKTALATNINVMSLSVRTANGSSLIAVSNLTIDGMPVTGIYARVFSTGESFWHIPSSSLANGFVITGTVTLWGSFPNNLNQGINFTFANSATAAAPLPVVWGGFAGKRVNASTVGLQWRTMQEQNASHYNVQRSEDGVRFRTIAVIAAQGTTSSVTDYSYNDKTATGTTHYYRLEQVDLDGSINYSSIIKQGNGGQKTLVGGLGSNKIMVQFFSNDTRQLRIVNNSGVIVKQINSSTQQQVVDVTSLTTGVYALQIINSDGTSEVHRFVK